jgi:hypothetical protein
MRKVAIRIVGGRNVFIDRVLTRGFDVGIEFDRSKGIIRNYYGDPIYLKQSEAQIIRSETRKIDVYQSRAELYDVIAWELIKRTSYSDDPVILDLRYYAQEVIDTRSPAKKKELLNKIKLKIQKHERYLKLIGYLKLFWDIFDKIKSIVG